MQASVVNKEGYQTFCATTVKEAISYLRSGADISLILCDLILPDQYGFEMLKFLNNNLRFCHFPVIMISGQRDLAFVAHALDLGAKDYLAKPYSIRVLLERIRGVIDAGLETILIVTDETWKEELLTRHLSRVGYKIITARDGTEGIEYLTNVTADGFLLDLALADMTGLFFLSQIQEKAYSVQALFFSDPHMNVSEECIIAAGGFGMLQMSFNNTEVTRRVAQMIAAKAS